MGINNYYHKNLKSELINHDYWDFTLSPDSQLGGEFIKELNTTHTECNNCLYDFTRNGLVVWFDTSFTAGTTNNILTSLWEWSGATINPSGVTLNDIGLTGIDNGYVDSLSATTTLTDKLMRLHPVTGYTHEYGIDITSSGDTCCPDSVGEKRCTSDGGFYQGFFKLHGYDYEVMPSNLDDGWTMETWIKPTPPCGDFFDGPCAQSITATTTLNSTYPLNQNFIFYIGTRAENKFDNILDSESGKTTSSGWPLNVLEEDELYRQAAVTEGYSGVTVGPLRPNGVSWFTKGETSSVCSIEEPTPSGTTSGTTSGETVTIETCDVLSYNAFGVRIDHTECKIGYRMLISSGDCETVPIVQEKYSDLHINCNCWNHIVVTYEPSGKLNKTTPIGTLKIFANGKRVLIEQDLPALFLRELFTHEEKQQGVPYNISWGGGTQGLLDNQTFGGFDPQDKNRLLEQQFAGHFWGELSQFRFYNRPLEIFEIRNNLHIGCQRYCQAASFGGRKILSPTITITDYLLLEDEEGDEFFLLQENYCKLILDTRFKEDQLIAEETECVNCKGSLVDDLLSRNEGKCFYNGINE